MLDNLEIQKLLEAPIMAYGLWPIAYSNKNIGALRDKVILELLCSFDLKIPELCRLTKNQIDLEEGKINIDKEIYDLDNQTKYWLKKYLDKRTDDLPFLFLRHDRGSICLKPVKPLTPRTIQRLVQKYARIARIKKKVTPKILR